MSQAQAQAQPIFLAVDVVELLHDRALQLYGGSPGLRDGGILASSVAQAVQGFGDSYLHDFPFGMAAAYAFHISQNQPFVDGNKRTGVMAALVFLDLNGFVVPSEKGGERLYQAMIAVAERTLDKASLARVFESLARAAL